MNELLYDHIESFDGVRTGNWSLLLERFADTAELEFRGVPGRPFVGKEAIAATYREQPPNDELRLLEEREREGRIEARYGWLEEPDVPAGELVLTAEGGLIRSLVVTFDRGVEWT